MAEGETSPKKVKRPATHADGHRARLRERFRRGGRTALQDYELLELLLFNAIPRRDVKPLAKTLLATFKTFADVISAPADQLRAVRVDTDGKLPLTVSDRVLDVFRLVRDAALELTQANILNRPILGSWQAVVDYCRASTAYEQIEQFRVLFLNNRNSLLADEKQQSGTIDHTPVYVRELIKRALVLNAKSMILVHNHPSGDPTPSKADIDLTRQIVGAATAVGVGVLDHLIIGRGAYTSFKATGLL